MTSQLTSYLPPGEGLLPKWLLLIGSVSVIYSIQSFISTRGAREVYAAPTTMVTPLSARTFGTWAGLSSVVRLYAAYNVNDKVAYELCTCTWIIALLHFGSEWLIFRTAKWSRGLASPLILASVTLAWMLFSYGDYVKP